MCVCVCVCEIARKSERLKEIQHNIEYRGGEGAYTIISFAIQIKERHKIERERGHNIEHRGEGHKLKNIIKI